MTTVIELLGGPGCGKSTLAAEIFVRLKQNGLSAELVPEHVKYWAWDGQEVGPFDQIHLFGQQARYESRLYDKVDYIISDSPVIMYPVYEEFYHHHSIIRSSVLAFIQETARRGIVRKTFNMPRVVRYDAPGRFESSETALNIDRHLEAFYAEQNYDYTTLGLDPKCWVDVIVESLT